MDAKKESLLSVLKKYPTNHVSCYAYFYDYNPYFKFNKDLVSRLNEYKIDIEFDMYFLSEQYKDQICSDLLFIAFV